MLKDFEYLLQIMNEDECLMYIVYEYDYLCTYYAIMPKDADIERIDIAACLEDTLHRLIEHNYKDKIRYVTGLKYRAGIDMNELNEDDNFTYIDLGYGFYGSIIQVKKDISREDYPYNVDDFDDSELPFC